MQNHDLKSAEKYLTKFSKQVRYVLDNSDKQIVSLENVIKAQNKKADSLLSNALILGENKIEKSTVILDSLTKVYTSNSVALNAIGAAKTINQENENNNATIKSLLGALAVVVLGLLFSNQLAKKKPEGWGAMQYPQLVLGMLAIFVYVGVEVAIGSNLSELLKQPDFGGFQSSEAAPYISMYWGSLMIGRWAGAVTAFKLSPKTKILLQSMT